MSVQAISDILAVTWGLEREPAASCRRRRRTYGRRAADARLRRHRRGGSREATLATPAELREHNFCCDFACLPFKDDEFDAVIETGLCRSAPNDVDNAIGEIRRVARRGVLPGSVTTDLPIYLIERFNLLEDVRVLCSRWDWSEKFHAAGFVHALFDLERLGDAWEKTEAAGLGPDQWYEDPEGLLYCVYERASKPGSLSLEEPPAADATADERELVAVG